MRQNRVRRKLARYDGGKTGRRISGIFFVALVLFLVLAPTQSIVKTDVLNVYLNPGPEHWLGTDNLGRDVYSLMVKGGLRTLAVVFISSAISFIGGISLGMIASYVGGAAQTAISFLADFTLVVPTFIVAVIFSAAFGLSPLMAGCVFGISNIGTYIQQADEMTSEMRDREFIRSEVVLGASQPRIIFRHIMPNIYRAMLVYLGNSASQVVLQYAGLAYIGVGTDITNPDWGTMLYQYRVYMISHPTLVLWPTLAIVILAVCFHFLFDRGAQREEATIFD